MSTTLRLTRTATTLGVLAVLGACADRQTAAPSPFIPTASIQEIMNAQIDPAADFIWEAVSTEITAEDTVEHQPQTDEEWLALRHAAIRLVESANLLVVDGRQVAAPGHTLEDAHVPGINSAAQIAAAIQADRSAFTSHAHALHAAATAVLGAIDARDIAGLVEAGGGLDEVCESCHLKYWYPNAPVPAELAAKP